MHKRSVLLFLASLAAACGTNDRTITGTLDLSALGHKNATLEARRSTGARTMVDVGADGRFTLELVSGRYAFGFRERGGNQRVFANLVKGQGTARTGAFGISSGEPVELGIVTPLVRPLALRVATSGHHDDDDDEHDNSGPGSDCDDDDGDGDHDDEDDDDDDDCDEPPPAPPSPPPADQPADPSTPAQFRSQLVEAEHDCPDEDVDDPEMSDGDGDDRPDDVDEDDDDDGMCEPADDGHHGDDDDDDDDDCDCSMDDR